MQKSELILNLLFIKAEKEMIHHKILKARSAKTIQTLRDEIYRLRREFSDLCYDNYELLASEVEKITDQNKNAFCVMAMVGGPYFIREQASLHAYKPISGGMYVIFDSFVGQLNFFEDKCGIDNLKILAENISSD